MLARTKKLAGWGATVGPVIYWGFVKLDMWVGHLTFWDNVKDKVVPVWQDEILPLMTTDHLAWICFAGGICTLIWVHFGHQIASRFRASLGWPEGAASEPGPQQDAIASSASHSPSVFQGRPTQPPELEDERLAKYSLAAFVAQKLLPAVEAQISVQDGVIGILTDIHIWMGTFARRGLSQTEEVKKITQLRRELIELISNDRIHATRLTELIKLVLEMRDAYKPFCDWSWKLAGDSSDPTLIDHAGRQKWAKLHNEMVHAYDALVSDPAFRGIYSPDGLPRFADPVDETANV